ncbi:MAG: HD domain-containing protein [bacterium]
MKHLFKLIEKEAGKNNDVYAVGGYIRDSLLGRTTQDIDFAVAHEPFSLAEKLAHKLNGTCIRLDDVNHIYRVIYPRHHAYIDISPIQGKTIGEDLARRDFTINAMARQLHNGRLSKIIDPFNGKRDLLLKKIQFISTQAVIDDPLRLIRAFRFSAELSFSINPASIALIRTHHALLANSSGERIREELFKILTCKNSGNIIISMDKTNLLTSFIPELEACRNTALEYYPKGGVISHCFESLLQMDYIIAHIRALFGSIRSNIRTYLYQINSGVYPQYVLLKAAALLHDIGKPSSAKIIDGRLRFFLHEDMGAEIIKTISKRLKLSNKQSHLLMLVSRAHMRPGNLAYADNITDRAIHRFFRDYGEYGAAVLLVSLADRFCYISERTIKNKTDRHHLTVLKLLKKYYLKNKILFPPRLINGTQLMRALHIPESVTVGKLLAAIREAQIEGRIHSKSDAVKFAKNKLNHVANTY